jgi:hypothetical protein
VTIDREVIQSDSEANEGDGSSELLPGMDIRYRDACRLLRALRKISYDFRGSWRDKPKKEEKKVYKAFITLEDQVGVPHLRHRVGRRERGNI